MKIAVSGKGGVGKTTVSAILARTFVEKGLKVLAIDADPSVNLPLSLGIPVEAVEQIRPIAENADLVAEKTGVRPDTYGGVFRLSFRVDDLVDRFAVSTPSGVHLLVMGAVRSAGQGCMCPANSLVQTLLRHLFTKRDEVIVVDLVAGVEHLGRGTAAHVDTMLIVSEPSLKSLETARRVFNLSKEAGIADVRAVGNKIVEAADDARVRRFFAKHEIPLLGLVPYDEAIRQSDAVGYVPMDRGGNHSVGVQRIREMGDLLLGALGPS